MNALLAEGKLEEMFKQNAEQKQTAMQEVYRQWRSAQTALATAGVQDNESDYQKIIWLLSAVMLIVVTVIIASWLAMQRVLPAAPRGDGTYSPHCRRRFDAPHQRRRQ